MWSVMQAVSTKDRLWTRDYVAVCLASFLMSFSFFILVPTLPLYLKDTFGIGRGIGGCGAVVLCCCGVEC